MAGGGIYLSLNYANEGSTYFPEKVWGNIQIKTVPFMGGYGYGKKGGGKAGHRRSL